MDDDQQPVGYRNPPIETRFKKGQSGNPRGRPKKKPPDLLADAAEIFAGPVVAFANGKRLTLPMMQVMFRGLCGSALRGDRQALRKVIELQLALAPIASAEEDERAMMQAQVREFLAKLEGIPPEQVQLPAPEKKKKKSEMTPEERAEEEEIAKLVAEEKRRLLREAKANR